MRCRECPQVPIVVLLHQSHGGRRRQHTVKGIAPSASPPGPRACAHCSSRRSFQALVWATKRFSACAATTGSPNRPSLARPAQVGPAAPHLRLCTRLSHRSETPSAAQLQVCHPVDLSAQLRQLLAGAMYAAGAQKRVIPVPGHPLHVHVRQAHLTTRTLRPTGIKPRI